MKTINLRIVTLFIVVIIEVMSLVQPAESWFSIFKNQPSCPPYHGVCADCSEAVYGECKVQICNDGVCRNECITTPLGKRACLRKELARSRFDGPTYASCILIDSRETCKEGRPVWRTG